MKYLLLILTSIALSFWKGFALMKNWNWFIKPKFDVEISIFYAMGFLITISLLTYQFSPKENEEETDWTKQILFGIIWPGFCLFFGWIYSKFI